MGMIYMGMKNIKSPLDITEDAKRLIEETGCDAYVTFKKKRCREAFLRKFGELEITIKNNEETLRIKSSAEKCVVSYERDFVEPEQREEKNNYLMTLISNMFESGDSQTRVYTISDKFE